MTECEIRRRIRQMYGPDPNWGFVIGIVIVLIVLLIARVFA